MSRRVFHSFHYRRDVHRVSQVRQIGSVSGQRILTPNDWETVKKKGKLAVSRWIGAQMRGKSCVVVLIGVETSKRPWVAREIEKGWKNGLGLLGVHIHNLKDLQGNSSRKGANPFRRFTVRSVNCNMASIVPVYDPPYTNSKYVYADIAANLEGWVEEAIEIRKQYPA